MEVEIKVKEAAIVEVEAMEVDITLFWTFQDG